MKKIHLWGRLVLFIGLLPSLVFGLAGFCYYLYGDFIIDSNNPAKLAA